MPSSAHHREQSLQEPAQPCRQPMNADSSEDRAKASTASGSCTGSCLKQALTVGSKSPLPSLAGQDRQPLCRHTQLKHLPSTEDPTRPQRPGLVSFLHTEHQERPNPPTGSHYPSPAFGDVLAHVTEPITNQSCLCLRRQRHTSPSMGLTGVKCLFLSLE